ncbi:MAG: glucosylceramidase, partial [Clostridiales bacterium]|nr:glucosylceramidase [Clostridiales bacterium]
MNAKYYQTSQDGEEVGELIFLPDEGEENEVINLYPTITYQTFEGFGGAITEAAAYVYQQMNETDKKGLMQRYFSKEHMKYQMVRISIDSCDFSLGHYEALSEDPKGDWSNFDFSRVEQYILPMLEDAQKAYGGKLSIMLTPWSPPAFMKSNQERNHGGILMEQYYPLWAEYICHYIKEFTRRGYEVKRLSIQNEPKAVQAWDSCIFTAKEEALFLRDYLAPAMKRHALSFVEVFIWDHNKERILERAMESIGPDTKDLIQGVAFHWYSGDHFEALGMLRECFPDKKMILSEACIEYCKYSKEEAGNHVTKYAHDIIGNFNQGMCAFYDWNLLLNEESGPNHVGNFCEAPFLYDTKQKKLLEQKTANCLWHFSHFIEAGD